MGLVVLEIISFRGVWTLVQSALHFNYTKLLTVYLALRSFPLLFSSQLVLVKTGVMALAWR